MEGGASATPLRWHCDANDAARASLDRPTFAARPVADPLKKVTSLLLFAAEKFAAVNDKLTKKAVFPMGARFLDEVRKPGFGRFKFTEMRFVASKLFIVAKTMKIMMSLLIKPGDPTL